MAYADLFGILW